MLTRIQAHIAAGYGYKLVDKEGNIFRILYPYTKQRIAINAEKDSLLLGVAIIINYSDIGTDYFILARDLSQLTEEIEHEGERFVPINKLKDVDGEYYIIKDDSEIFFDDKLGLGIYEVTRCESLITKLYEWHFAFKFPTQCVKQLK